jgi:casein kinase 1
VNKINTPLRARTPAIPPNELSDILNGLTNLRLGPQPVLADRTNAQEVPRKANVDGGGGGGGGNKPIIISSDSETRNRVPRGSQPTKALRLRQLADKASNATDNGALSQSVREFQEILQMNSSRTLTKEAFYFLDVLFKQLDDPSVFVKPTRFAFPYLMQLYYCELIML